MRALALALMVAASPAWAQTGLTPATQMGSLCARAMNLRALGFGNSTNISNACGSGAALASTIASGRTGLDNLISLFAAARAARDTRLQSAAP